MKQRMVMSCGVLTAIAATIGTAGALTTEEPEMAGGSDGFAVVELFTSEGCSSCPPADRLLSELIEESRREGTRVLALAYHVDYWDRLGWPDRFADAAYTDRQRAYVKALGARNLYTPQMVVSGTTEFTGSDGDRARREIKDALEKPVSAPVTLEVKRGEGGAIVVRYSVMLPESVDMVSNASLHVALVEDGLASEVKKGENAGKTLQHDAVVRAFTTVKPGNVVHGTIEMKPPEDLKPENASVIAFVQHGKTMHIHGAASVAVK